MIEIYTDGGCKKNPGPGACAFVVLVDGKIMTQTIRGSLFATNNEMEFFAVIEAIKWVNKHYPGQGMTIYTDSQYVVNVYNIWYDKWVDECKLKTKKNVEIIQELMKLRTQAIKIVWVKGHSDNKYNNLADILVKEGLGNVTDPDLPKSSPLQVPRAFRKFPTQPDAIFRR